LNIDHPDFIGERLTARQYLGWQRFHKSHNLLFDRDDTFITQLLAMYFNCHKPKNESMAKATDFVPWLEQKPITAEELKHKLGFA
jgi:hypothetical protein